MGADIFANGARPAIPACATCHGQDGKGLGKAPRIAGRDQDYLEKQLHDFNQVKRIAEPMNTHTWDMTSEQMHALAVYLSSN